MDTMEVRRRVAQAIRESCQILAERPPSHYDVPFFDRLNEIDLSLYSAPTRIPDKTLNAAINFCDDYFDAVCHGQPDLCGLPYDKAREMAEEVIQVLSTGDEITNPAILAFAHDWKRPQANSKTILSLSALFIVLLAAMLVIDFIGVRMVDANGLVFQVHCYSYGLSFAVAAGLFLLVLGWCRTEMRIVKRILVSLILAAVWWGITLLAVLQFHISIGGWL